MRTWIEIDASAVQHNLQIISQLADDSVEIGVVLKGNAYGHGIELIAGLVTKHTRVTWLMVAGTKEALVLRRTGCLQSIMVLSYIEDDLSEAIKNDVVLPVIDFFSAENIQKNASCVGKKARVHIKIDTGMCRLGILPEELSHFIAQIQDFDHLIIDGLFTHLATSHDSNAVYGEEQLHLFEQLCVEVDPQHVWYHHAIASGSLWCRFMGDIVRVGTMAYGSWKSASHRARIQASFGNEVELRPIMTWKTRILHCKKVQAGAFVGYDRTFCAPYDMKIAILPVGYADGYPRRLSNCGVVAIGSSYASVIGIVSMNLMAVDVTHIPHVVVGDEVMLLGPVERITPVALATLLGTNPNDITAAIHCDIPRYVVEQDIEMIPDVPLCPTHESHLL